MTVLSDRTALDVWEAGSTRHPLDRRLVLLAGANPHASIEDLAALDVQQRDRALLEIRRDTFGDRFELQASCDRCAIALEFEASAEALMEMAPATDPAVDSAEWHVEFRLPNSIDLASAITDGDDLFAVCVTKAQRAGEAAAVEEIPVSVRAQVEDAMAALAPASDIEFAVICEECQTETILPFDAGEILWREVSMQARRLLTEIVLLARAFGWDESQILALSPRRRRTYLEAVS